MFIEIKKSIFLLWLLFLIENHSDRYVYDSEKQHILKTQ